MTDDILAQWLDADQSAVLVLENYGTERARRLLACRSPIVQIIVRADSELETDTRLVGCLQDVIEQLIAAPELSIGDELQQLLDDGLYSRLLPALFELLWTARFEHEEGYPIGDRATELLSMTFSSSDLFTRCDATLFWFSLLGTAGSGRTFLTVLGNDLSPEVATLIQNAPTWKEFGSPLRILVLRDSVEC